MSSKTVSFDLDSANFLWLQARATASGRRNLSRVLNEILDQLRAAGQGQEVAVRSIRGTIELPDSDPDLEKAKETVGELFRRSIERTAGFLAQTEET
jgi:hypothetical protein